MRTYEMKIRAVYDMIQQKNAMIADLKSRCSELKFRATGTVHSAVLDGDMFHIEIGIPVLHTMQRLQVLNGANCRFHCSAAFVLKDRKYHLYSALHMNELQMISPEMHKAVQQFMKNGPEMVYRSYCLIRSHRHDVNFPGNSHLNVPSFCYNAVLEYVLSSYRIKNVTSHHVTKELCSVKFGNGTMASFEEIFAQEIPCIIQSCNPLHTASDILKFIEPDLLFNLKLQGVQEKDIIDYCERLSTLPCCDIPDDIIDVKPMFIGSLQHTCYSRIEDE